MKATEQFNQDFRPHRTKSVDMYQESFTILKSNDVLMNAKLTLFRYGLEIGISNF